MSLIDKIDQVIADAESREVGKGVIRALKRAKRTIPEYNTYPTPREWSPLYKPILEACEEFPANKIEMVAKIVASYDRTEPETSETLLEVIKQGNVELIWDLSETIDAYPNDLNNRGRMLHKDTAQMGQLVNLFLKVEKKHPGLSSHIRERLRKCVYPFSAVEVPKNFEVYAEFIEDRNLFMSAVSLIDIRGSTEKYETLRKAVKQSPKHVLKVNALVNIGGSRILGVLSEVSGTSSIGLFVDVMSEYQSIFTPKLLGEVFKDILEGSSCLRHVRGLAREDVKKAFTACDPWNKPDVEVIQRETWLAFCGAFAVESEHIGAIAKVLTSYVDTPRYKKIFHLVDEIWERKPNGLEFLVQDDVAKVMKSTEALDIMFADGIIRFVGQGKLDKARKLVSGVLSREYSDEFKGLIRELGMSPYFLGHSGKLLGIMQYVQGKDDLRDLDQNKLVKYFKKDGLVDEIPKQLNVYLPLRVVNRLVEAEEVAVKKFPESMDKAKAIYRGKLKSLLEESDDVRTQAQILYEWSSEVIRIIKTEPEKLLYGVGVC